MPWVRVPPPALALAVGTDAFQLDRVVVDQEAGSRANLLLAGAEVSVVDVDAPPAERADYVVVVRQLGPLVPRPALAPVDPPHAAVGLEPDDDPVDGRIRRRRQAV